MLKVKGHLRAQACWGGKSKWHECTICRYPLWWIDSVPIWVAWDGFVQPGRIWRGEDALERRTMFGEVKKLVRTNLSNHMKWFLIQARRPKRVHKINLPNQVHLVSQSNAMTQVIKIKLFDHGNGLSVKPSDLRQYTKFISLTITNDLRKESLSQYQTPYLYSLSVHDPGEESWFLWKLYPATTDLFYLLIYQ